MITIRGVDETIEAMVSMPDRLGVDTVLADVSHEFSGRLRAATPVGYSGDLQSSVMSVPEPGRSVVGYGKGVETAGGESRRKSVLYRKETMSRKRIWVPSEELASILFEAFSAYEKDGVERLESSLAEAVNRGGVT